MYMGMRIQSDLIRYLTKVYKGEDKGQSEGLLGLERDLKCHVILKISS